MLTTSKILHKVNRVPRFISIVGKNLREKILDEKWRKDPKSDFTPNHTDNLRALEKLKMLGKIFWRQPSILFL